MFQAAKAAAVAHEPLADDQHSSGMHDGIEFLLVIAELCVQCAVEAIGQVLDGDLIGQRLVITDAYRVDLPSRIAAYQLVHARS